MKNSEHWDLENLKNRLAEKVHKIENEDERDRLLKIVVDLGQTLESIEPEEEPENLKYFRPGPGA